MLLSSVCARAPPCLFLWTSCASARRAGDTWAKCVSIFGIHNSRRGLSNRRVRSALERRFSRPMATLSITPCVTSTVVLSQPDIGIGDIFANIQPPQWTQEDLVDLVDSARGPSRRGQFAPKIRAPIRVRDCKGEWLCTQCRVYKPQDDFYLRSKYQMPISNCKT